ncbi:YCF48-related protein [Pseudomonas sp. BN607]|uniref:WD40/YVTN/BNR-like repeat-containing protein n=1 Tax=Pseudomonas sp. BN607 TaxID=2567895 RepID=UPI0024590A99|nr:YCF48-related protein [Pseudomonas sp. BN607]MDH4549903.1 glycosyl hydrolase [Pseudomonas sp. BN607]
MNRYNVPRDFLRQKNKAITARLLIAAMCLMPGVLFAVEQMPSNSVAFEDPLDHSAKSQTHLQDRPLMAVTTAGQKLIAVGMRGLVIVSDDNGLHWRQARVPVQSDLLAVMFPTANKGWAVGHDGTILHSQDGGETWILQLDGRAAEHQFVPFYQARADQGDSRAQAIVEGLKINFRSGPSLPYLSVWFENESVGYAVGSFGSIVATTDGGKHWLPWYERIENPEGLNLNGIYGVGAELLIVGEQGHVFKLDRDTRQFRSIRTGYEGSFFSVLGNDEVLVAFGLRGKFFRSTDHGETWSAGVLPATSTIASGAALANGGGFVMVNAAGQLLLADPGATQVRVASARKAMRLTAVAPLPGNQVVVAGLRGIGLEPLPSLSSR